MALCVAAQGNQCQSPETDTSPCVPRSCCLNPSWHHLQPSAPNKHSPSRALPPQSRPPLSPSHASFRSSVLFVFVIRVHIFAHLKGSWAIERLPCLPPTLCPEPSFLFNSSGESCPRCPVLGATNPSGPGTPDLPGPFPVHCVNAGCRILFILPCLRTSPLRARVL